MCCSPTLTAFVVLPCAVITLILLLSLILCVLVLCLPQCSFLVRCSPSLSVLACALCSPFSPFCVLVFASCLRFLDPSLLCCLCSFRSFFGALLSPFLVLVSALCASSVLSSPSCPDAVPLYALSCMCCFRLCGPFFAFLCFFAFIGFIVASLAPLQSPKNSSRWNAVGPRQGITARL